MLTDIPNSPAQQSPPQPSYTRVMNPARQLAICLITCAALAAEIAAAQAPAQPQPPQRQFEVAALKASTPDQHSTSWRSNSDRITIQNYTLRHLILVAYDLKSENQILGGPDWIDKSHFDIAAKLDEADAAAIYKLPDQESRRQVLLMLQNFLSDRFHLKVKQDQRTLPVYSLEIAKSGAKITPLPKPDDAEAKKRSHGTSTNNGHLTAMAISMNTFADYLTEWAESGDRVVVNRTNLDGEYNFTLNWTQDRGAGIPADAQFPGLFTALQEQLGLTLKSGKAEVPVVVVESASMPQFD